MYNNPIFVNSFSLFQNWQKSLGGGILRSIGKIQLVHNYQYIISLENLLKAWGEFKVGKKLREDVQEFEYKLMGNIIFLHNELANKKYRHSPYQAFNISDPKPRNIHKASVRDRLLHHAIYRVLYPFLDRIFIADSYSCRINRGTHKAINRFRDFSRKVSKNNTRTCWILKCDIRKFFENIDHDILKNILARHIVDKDVVWLLGQIIDSFNAREKNDVGLPLGNLTSQLFVNVYMNEFDQFAKQKLKIKYYIRYADDFVIIHKDKNYLKNLVPRVSEFLDKRLKLSLHPGKLFIKTLNSGVDFLGWVNFPDHRVLRTITKRRMFRNIEFKEGKEETVQSYLGLLSHGNARKLKTRVVKIIAQKDR